MQFKEVEDSLPNGFHDAVVQTVTMDYVSRKAVIKMQLWVGDLDAATEIEREAHKAAELHLSDVLYFVIDAPDPKYKFAERRELRIDAGGADEESAPAPPIPLAQLPAGASAHWFFVNDWNSFIHIAAMDAQLEWR